MSEPTSVDKAQKGSAAVGLIIIVVMVGLIGFGIVNSFIKSRAKSAEADRIDGELAAIEASQDTPSLKSKRFLEIAYSSWEVAEAVDAKHSENYTLNRVGQHIQSGYNDTDPLSAPIFEKAAMATCLIRVRQLDSDSSTYVNDIYNAYLAAKNDFEAWRPYLVNSEQAWESCAFRFRFMHDKHMKHLEKQKQFSMKEIGAKVGQATSEVGKMWNNAIQPLSDAVDDFKAGYQSGK